MEQSMFAQLVAALLAIPDINDFDTRTALLIGIPNYLSLNRNPTNSHTDISLLVNQLNHIQLQSSESALEIFINNARNRVQGTTLNIELEELGMRIQVSLRDKRSAHEIFEQTPDVKGGIDPGDLRKAILSTYDIAELQILCSDLHLLYDNLGEGPIEVKIDRLIQQYHRSHGTYDGLVQQVLKDRPHLVNELQKKEAQGEYKGTVSSQEQPPKSHSDTSKQKTSDRGEEQTKTTSDEDPCAELESYRMTIAQIEEALDTHVRFLTFSRLQSYEKKLVSVVQVIRNTSEAAVRQCTHSREAVLMSLRYARDQLNLAIIQLEQRDERGKNNQFFKHISSCRQYLEEALKYWK